jgi:hypothetical protein
VLVLEMAMRGAGQIAELARIAEPDVGLVTNVGPVHLEQLGSLDAIAAEKMALVAALPAGGTAVVPAGDPRVAAHLRPDLQTVTFGPGGDVTDADLAGLDLELTSAHMRLNAQAALAAARALGIEPAGRIPVALSAMRGQRRTLPGGIVVVEDCYNANPMSMRAALDDLAASAPGRKVAVLGDMLELGPDERAFHRQVGEHARAAGIDVLVGVGPRSAHMAPTPPPPTRPRPPRSSRPAAAGDTVLVKASRGVGLEAVVQACSRAGALTADGRDPHRGHRVPAHLHLPEPELHRLAARPRVRPADPRGGARRPPRQGGDADHGRDHHLHGDLRAVPDPGRLQRLAGGRGLHRRDRVRGPRARRRRPEGLQAPVARAAGPLEARHHHPDLAVPVVGGHGAGGAELDAAPALHRRHDRPRDLLSRPDLPRGGGDVERREPHGRARRPRAGCAAIVLLAYIGITFITQGQQELALLCGCLVGACVGFLWFNAFPATIFMGDTGSLGLGGAIAGWRS